MWDAVNIIGVGVGILLILHALSCLIRLKVLRFVFYGAIGSIIVIVCAAIAIEWRPF